MLPGFLIKKKTCLLSPWRVGSRWHAFVLRNTFSQISFSFANVKRLATVVYIWLDLRLKMVYEKGDGGGGGPKYTKDSYKNTFPWYCPFSRVKLYSQVWQSMFSGSKMWGRLSAFVRMVETERSIRKRNTKELHWWRQGRMSQGCAVVMYCSLGRAAVV